MEFCTHLSMDYKERSYGGERIYRDMIEQAVLADRSGFDAVSVTEHHLVNLGMMPATLMSVVKLAAHTQKVKIITAVAVLPLHDMRSYAGEVIVADIFTEGRMILGVGRGAYAFEMERFGVPMDVTREKFDESLDVLTTLLREEEVAWKGKYYNFDALTVMPRPRWRGGPDMLMAALHPEAIYHSTKRGFHILTTPLHGDRAHLVAQVDAFRRARDEMGEAGAHLTLMLSRAAFVTRSEKDRRQKVELANDFFARFDNVYTGPGIVDAGMARVLPRKQTLAELEQNLLICTPQEMTDKLGEYADLGIDRVSLTMNFGASQADTLESTRAVAEEVIPHFRSTSMKKTAELV